MNTVKNFTTILCVKLDRCVGSCNSINDLTNKVCVPYKREDLNLSVSDIITGINESKTCHVCEKDYVWNPPTCNCENRKC